VSGRFPSYILQPGIYLKSKLEVMVQFLCSILNVL
jgi:hypothetical protein